MALGDFSSGFVGCLSLFTFAVVVVSTVVPEKPRKGTTAYVTTDTHDAITKVVQNGFNGHDGPFVN